MVIAGGVIPPQDYAFLYEHGATCIFGPGSIIPECAKEMLIALNKRLGYTCLLYTSAPSPWPPTPTWRWSPSSSRPS